MIKIKLDAEKIILVIFLVILLFIGPGSIFSHQLKHDFPYGYSASDAFQHQTRAEAIKDAGNFRNEASYISFGLEGLVGRYPPTLYHLAVIFSYASGMEVYDSIYFIVLLFSVVGAAMMYFIIRNFNKNAALISLPLMILIFASPPSMGFSWGHWPSLLAQVFLIAFAWCIVNIELKNSYFLIALILAAIALTHTSEAVFAAIFIAIFFIFKLITGKLEKNSVKNISIGIAAFLIVSSYYLIIFMNTWAKAQPYSFSVMPAWEGNPGFYIMGFGILLIFIVIGIVFSLLKIKDIHAALIFAFAMLLSGFLNYAGFDTRAFQIRFFWPIYLSVFFGFGVYMIMKILIKQWNQIYSLAVLFVFIMPLIGLIKIPLVPYYENNGFQGLMDPYHWDALKWLSEKTEPDAKIYFFYGDIYGQDALLRNSKRTHYQADPKNFVQALQNSSIRKAYVSELPGDSGGRPVVRKRIFDFEDVVSSKPQEFFFGPQNICNFDYLVFDKASQQQALAQYNMLIASELLKKEFIEIVQENKAVVILKNNKVGADCIEERSF